MNIPEALARTKQLAHQLQAAAFSSGYEDAHPSNAWTRQDRTAAVSRAKLDELLAAIDALAAAPPAPVARQLHSFSSIDCEALIAAVLPGGSVCDPQQVADAIRTYLNAWAAPAAQASDDPIWHDIERELRSCTEDGCAPALDELDCRRLLRLMRAHGIGTTGAQEGEHGR